MELNLTEKRSDVPMSAPDITDLEREAIAEVLRTPRLSFGPQVEAFEAAAAKIAGLKHAIAVSSGTTGLHLCIRAAGIQDADLVVTTPFSFVASANVLLYERAIPVFVDVEEATGNISPELVSQAVDGLMEGGKAANAWTPRKVEMQGGRLKAILSVDVFGQPADYDPLLETANSHGLSLIEDSCEAIGAAYKSKPAGSFGDVGTFAFYPNKQITTGEGGVVVTDRDDWAEMIRALRNQGRAEGDVWLQHTYLGYNYRLDELSAALGKVQLSRLNELMEKREQVASWYRERLADIQGVQLPTILPSTTRMSWFVYVVRLDPGIDREAVIRQLAAEGIPTRRYFAPIHLQPYFVERFGYREGDFPVAEDLGRRSVALPFSSPMNEDEVDRVCRSLASVLGSH